IMIEEFKPDNEERARRLQAEVDRMSRLSVVEWMLYLDDTAAKHGVEPAKLKAMVEAVIKEREKKAREEKVEQEKRERRAEKQRAAARRKEERAREKADKELAAAEKAAEKAAAVEAEAGKLLEPHWEVKPAEDPVDAAQLFAEIEARILQHVVMPKDFAFVAALWVGQSWIHNHATYSPILGVTSAER